MSNLENSDLVISPNQRKICLKVILVFKILIIFFLQFLLYSCASDFIIMDGSKYNIREDDDQYQLDSFKVVKVIDNRKTKDSVIGNVEDRNDDDDMIPLIINRPLPDYLKMMFNVFLAKDSSKTNLIPVTVYVDEFFSERVYNQINQKYSFLFEYPVSSEMKSFRVENTKQIINTSIKIQKSLVISSIREAAKSLSLHLNQDSINANESKILDGSFFRPIDEDKKFRIDSFKVVNVIDNRKVKDSIIGYTDVYQSPLIINRPLPDYLKMMLNILITKDSSIKNFIPVSVYIDDFFSINTGIKRWNSENKEDENIINNKFSYWFEYPYKSEIKKTKIVDSVAILSNSIQGQKNLIIYGIRETANIFSWNVRNMLSLDSVKMAKPDTIIKSKNIDTIDVRLYRESKGKSGFLLNYYSGLKTNENISISLVDVVKYTKSFWEFGAGLGYQHSNIDTQDNKQMYCFIVPKIFRYYFTTDTSGAYLDGVFVVGLGAEKSSTSSERFIFGLRLEETIGYNLFKYLSMEVGLYQQGFLLSKFLPYDFGFVISFNLTNGY